MTELVAREVAEQEFQRFTDSMEIDTDTSKMKEDDADGFQDTKEKIISAIMDGRLTVNDQGEPVLTPTRTQMPNGLTFKEPSGADLMAMDRQKNGNDVGKMFALMDSVTKSAPGTCSKLKGKDQKVATAIVTLFLA